MTIDDRATMREGVSILLATGFLLLAACGGSQSSLKYNVGLDGVERSVGAESQYGEARLLKRSLDEGTEYIYRDDLVSVSVIPRHGLLRTKIENQSGQTIQVKPEQGGFIGVDGTRQRLLNVNQGSSSLTIPSRESRLAVLLPEGNVSHTKYSGLEAVPLVSPQRVTDQTSQNAAEQTVGDILRLVLPIEVQGETSEYTFHFEVLGAQVPSPNGRRVSTVGDPPN